METEDCGPKRHTTKSKIRFELGGNVCLYLHTLLRYEATIVYRNIDSNSCYFNKCYMRNNK